MAWRSLNEGDNDPIRFLIYLVAAVRTICEALLGVLRSPQPPPTESFPIALLSEIATTTDEFVLVLDDHHVLDAKPVDAALTFARAFATTQVEHAWDQLGDN